METPKEKLISHLNHLITICNDGKHGYSVAAKDAESEDLKGIFYSYSVNREEFANALRAEVNKLGGEPDLSGGPIGALHRAWIDIKSTLSTNDDKAILDSCITGERAAVNAYREVLSDALLPADIQNLASIQSVRVEEALQRMEALYLAYTS
ncbi:ferritin-like domain-containing protein [Rubrolithibacter danxiaensis]|uniref:ferritin-like domain-containing protein n=1 Tax=Rubrolithibacter danxiaensis TaxID=3390805 RepID=UPI003BF7BA69